MHATNGDLKRLLLEGRKLMCKTPVDFIINYNEACLKKMLRLVYTVRASWAYFLEQKKLMCLICLLDMSCHCFLLDVFGNGAVWCLPGSQCWNSSTAARSARSRSTRTVCLAKVQQLSFISAPHCSLEGTAAGQDEGERHIVNPPEPLLRKQSLLWICVRVNYNYHAIVNFHH